MSDAAFTPVADGTLSALLRTVAARRPDAEALVYPAFVHGDDALRLTFAQLDARVDALARGLMATGLAKGDHVALWACNVPDWVPLEFALARIGAVLVTVNTALKSDDLSYVLRKSGAVAVLHGARHGSLDASAVLDELFRRDDPGVAALRYRIWLPALPGELPPQGLHPMSDERRYQRGPLLSISEVVDEGRHTTAAELSAREASCDVDDVVNIQYTSGTTGLPKGVMLSHRNLVANGAAIAGVMDTTPDDRVGLMVPLFHCFGCVACVIGAYSHGAALCAVPSFDPYAVLRMVTEEKVTVLSGVPTMFNALLAHPALENTDLSSLRTGLVAGAPVPPSLIRDIARRMGCAGHGAGYGLTEASPGVSGSHPGDPVEQRCGTVGRPLPGVEVRIVDPATARALPPGRKGEVQVRGSNVMVGYHGEPQATATVVTPEGWLRTGDLGVFDEAGCLSIVGRIKDIIIRGGENIAPAEIEAVLREHGDVVDAAVVGVPDDHFGEEVAAVVVLRAGARLDPERLAAHVGEHLAAFKVPKSWRAVEAFPLTGSGKVRKFELRALFGGG